MTRKSKPLTVRCWAPDENCPGGYRPVSSLNPKALEEFKRKNMEAMLRVWSDIYDIRPVEDAR